MTLIIHDMDDTEFNKTVFKDIKNSKILKLDNIKPCLGCFNCWLKSPGICTLNDDYKINGALLSTCDRLIVISKNYYGMFSPNIKNFFDRSISYVKPYFRIIYGEMHHKKRYKNILNIDYYIYGDINSNEENTIKNLIKANSENLFSNNRLTIIDKWEDYYV